jgi:membrane protein
VNVAYDEEDSRNPVKKRLLALALTLGAIVFVVVMLGLVAVVPALLQTVLGDSPVIKFTLSAGRWILLVVLVTAALAVLYRVAPDRDAPKIRWVSVGAAVATLLWLLASIGFSVYVSTFGNYAKTYGVFAGIIVLLFWLWITSYAVLLGAEINAEAEQQTVADTTTGPAEPLGERNAVKADSTPSDQPSPPRSRTR